MSAPSNNNFRISGAMGIDPAPTDPSTQEVLTQGLGFPLRPISNVTPTTAPEIGNGVLAEGQPMQWMGNWTEGLYYPKGSFVRDGEFTCISNNLTLEKPAPIPDPADPATYGLPTYVPVTQSNASTVTSGNRAVFSQTGWIKELRVWVTETTPTTTYRIVAINTTNPDAPITISIVEPVLTANAWTTVGLLNTVINIGESYSFVIEALNSGAATNISGGWQYQGPTQSGAPIAQNWTQDNQRTSFRIDKTDLDSTDRGTELEGVIPDSIISVVETNNVANTVIYRVTSVTDNTTYMTYGVTLQDETGAITTNAICTLDISIPIPLPTEYAEETAVVTVPTWASSVEGFLQFDGVDQGVPVTNAYGVDLLFEPAQVSTDWDIVTFIQ